MDLTALVSRARFQVGDRVRLQAGEVWVVTGRYWRRRTREIVYDITVHRLTYTTRVAEHRLYPVREG
ncbi:MAG: hypothetical protein IPJ87_15490 [Flavobacteriales bacterium]|jgi:hypothetical protein|nr:hypothetical protein [Flavobacteriales bacterium]MBK7943252.1 hypothetical protein [Flavobacteriales bacterium]MBK8947892.1 hypothetical protein [Flavobacteriales bacterium]MBK9700059.1 hypothetical protein [Flavobacteriales bacterium]